MVIILCKAGVHEMSDLHKMMLVRNANGQLGGTGGRGVVYRRWQGSLLAFRLKLPDLGAQPVVKDSCAAQEIEQFLPSSIRDGSEPAGQLHKIRKHDGTNFQDLTPG